MKIFQFLLGVFLGIFFSWSPVVVSQSGQNKKKPVVSSADTTVVPRDSIAATLAKAELELYWLKRQRHQLLKALENKQYRLHHPRRKRQEWRRPCT